MIISKLKQIGLENPSNPRIFGNNFGQLSYYNDDPKPDDLKELPVMMFNGSDGVFNEGDYLLFYARGTGRWKLNNNSGTYDYLRHNYSDTAFYFITSASVPGKNVTLEDDPVLPANYFTSQSDALFIHETDKANIMKYRKRMV